MLKLHVLDLREVYITEFKAFLDSLAGVVGVYVHLDYLIIINYDHAVTDGLKVCPQLDGVIAIGLFGYEHLGAIGEVYLSIILTHYR